MIEVRDFVVSVVHATAPPRDPDAPVPPHELDVFEPLDDPDAFVPCGPSALRRVRHAT